MTVIPNYVRHDIIYRYLHKYIAKDAIMQDKT